MEWLSRVSADGVEACAVGGDVDGVGTGRCYAYAAQIVERFVAVGVGADGLDAAVVCQLKGDVTVAVIVHHQCAGIIVGHVYVGPIVVGDEDRIDCVSAGWK